MSQAQKRFDIFKLKVTRFTFNFGKNIVILQTLTSLPFSETEIAQQKKIREKEKCMIFFKRNFHTVSFPASGGELNEDDMLVKNYGTLLHELLHFCCCETSLLAEVNPLDTSSALDCNNKTVLFF